MRKIKKKHFNEPFKLDDRWTGTYKYKITGMWVYETGTKLIGKEIMLVNNK